MKKVDLEKKVSELERRLEAIEYTLRSPYYNSKEYTLRSPYYNSKVPKFIGGK